MSPSSASGKNKRASTRIKIRKSDSIQLLGGFHKVHKIWRSATFTRPIGGRAAGNAAAAAAVPIPIAAPGSQAKLPTPSAQIPRQKEIGERIDAADVASFAAARAAAAVPTLITTSFLASDKGDHGSQEKLPTPPAQSLRQEEIGEKTAAAAADSASTAAPVPNPMAASVQEKGSTPPARGGSLRAIVLLLTVVAVAITTLLLLHFHGHPMSQVWILSISICSYVFFFLFFICPSRSFYTDFCRLSYGPMLAFCSACGIGSATATFVLLFSMTWASANLGYSLALHRLHNGTETAIRTVPRSSYPTKNGVKGFNASLYNLTPFMVLLWTLLMVLVVNVAPVADELEILIILSYFGWIHVALGIIIFTLVYMHGFPLKEPVEGWLLPVFLIWMPLSPLICFVSKMLAVLCHLLLMMAFVAFLWYNLAIYIHFLATITPRTTTQGNEDTRHSKILEDKIGLMKSVSSASDKADLGSEKMLPTPPAQSLQQQEIVEKTAATDVVSTAAAVPNPMAASSASVVGNAGTEEKGPTSPAGGGSLRAIALVLTVVALAVTILLLVHFQGHPMSQVWILSVSICSYIFFFLLFIWRSRSFYTDFYRLSYGPMLAFCTACGIGSATATFVLLFSMAWASGNLGYSLALHRLHNGTETAIRTVPRSSYPTKNGVKGFNASLYNVTPFMVLLWTLLMVLVVNVAPVADELEILIILSYFGWIHVALGIIIFTLVYMHGFPLKEPVEGWLLPVFLIWMPLSPLICFVSKMLAVLCHLLLMMAFVAFLWYNLAIYIHFLATITPRTTTQGNEDTRHSKILEDKIGLMKSVSSASDKADLGSEKMLPTPPAQSLQQQEIVEKTAATDVVSTAAAVPNPMAASSASVVGNAGTEEKGPTSPAGGGSLRAIALVLTVVALAVTILLLVHFQGHPMSQVWILSVSICSYIFFFLLFIWRSRSFYTDFYRLSYGPMLAFCTACGIGSATATFVLLFSMAWASGNLGYSLALHRLHNGTEMAIRTVPSSSYPTKNGVKGFNATLYNVAPFVVLLWTLLMVLVVNVAAMADELDILIILSYFGWIHVAIGLMIVTLVYMHGFPLKEQIGWLLPVLLIWIPFSPAICFVSQILAVLCHLLLMMAFVAFLWYNLAIYIHFLATCTPSTTTQRNVDTLHSKILEDKIGLMKSDPRLGITTSDDAATLGYEDTLHSEILRGKFGPLKSDPGFGGTPS